MIGEFASCEAGPCDLPGQTKAAWIAHALQRLTSPDYAGIRAVCWFHVAKERAWQVDSSADSLAAVRLAMQNTCLVSHPAAARVHLPLMRR